MTTLEEKKKEFFEKWNRSYDEDDSFIGLFDHYSQEYDPDLIWEFFESYVKELEMQHEAEITAAFKRGQLSAIQQYRNIRRDLIKDLVGGNKKEFILAEKDILDALENYLTGMTTQMRIDEKTNRIFIKLKKDKGGGE